MIEPVVALAPQPTAIQTPWPKSGQYMRNLIWTRADIEDDFFLFHLWRVVLTFAQRK